MSKSKLYQAFKTELPTHCWNSNCSRLNTSRCDFSNSGNYWWKEKKNCSKEANLTQSTHLWQSNNTWQAQNYQLFIISHRSLYRTFQPSRFMLALCSLTPPKALHEGTWTRGTMGRTPTYILYPVHKMQSVCCAPSMILNS